MMGYNSFIKNMKKKIHIFEKNLNKSQVHGRNILAKLKRFESLNDKQKEKIINIVLPAYEKWKRINETLKGYTEEIVKKRVQSLNEYKNKIELVEFSAQTKFHSSVIEEFLYYLFKDLINGLNNLSQEKQKIALGGIRAYTNLYFAPENLKSFIKKPYMRINVKDQDFAIYKKIKITADGESKEVNVPVVSIECKTYIDKTMLEGSIATAEKIRNGNPYCLFLVVSEWYDVSYEVDPAYSRIDQIYILRKEKRKTKESNPIDFDVVNDLFNFVKNHLERDWSKIEEKLLKEGKIL